MKNCMLAPALPQPCRALQPLDGSLNVKGKDHMTRHGCQTGSSDDSSLISKALAAVCTG